MKANNINDGGKGMQFRDFEITCKKCGSKNVRVGSNSSFEPDIRCTNCDNWETEYEHAGEGGENDAT